MTAIYTTTHEGQTATRKSAGHIAQEYTHAVWVQDRKGEWGCYAYSSRLDLAQKRAAEYSRHYEGGWVQSVAVVPVTCEIKLTKKQKEWLAAQQAVQS